ncbi:MAG: hypothetical protein IKB04_07665 [Clostridia bacterium]|nr:hypothetical protein [Clostridia bacterium]
MNELFAVLGLLLAVCGAAALLWWLMACWLRPCEGGVFVIPISGERWDAEYLVRTARLHACGARVVLLDCGLSAKCAAVTQEICSRLNTELIDEKEWEILIKSALQEGERGV